jgi:prepilin-type N-terminal cleavage/methylation domain-containing protein
LRLTRSTASPARPDGRPQARRLKGIRNGQAGYTVIEMIMVIAILGLLTVAVNQVIAHTVRISSHGKDSMTAMKQLENAFYWATIDVQQSRAAEVEANSGFPCILSWVEWDGTSHAVSYAIEGTEIKRSVSINGTEPVEMVVARYINTSPADTNCRLSGSGTFSLLDAGDAITITGGQEASSGYVYVGSGGVSVTTTGTATYDSGEWSTPAAGDSVTITATASNTRGTWSSENTAASLALSEDGDGDASLKGTVLILNLSAFGGERSTHIENRQGVIYCRS